MKNLLSTLSVSAALAMMAAFAGCSNDNDITADEPEVIEPEPEEGSEFDPRLEGIWLLTDEGDGSGAFTPVAIEESSLLIADPAEQGAIFLDFDNLAYFESAFFADANNMVAIEHTLADYIIEALKEAGVDDPDLTFASAPEIDEMWFFNGAYKLLNDTTLVIDFEFEEGILSGKFRRMTEVEADFGKQTRFDVFGKLGELVNKAIEVVVKVKDSIIGSTYHEFDKSLPHTKNWTDSYWLGLLPDDMPICKISIPGAHDACTATVSSVGVLANADCQTKTIKGLLGYGVRYLDCRTRSSGMEIPDEILVKLVNTGINFTEQLFKIELNKYKHDGIAWTFHGPMACGESLETVFQHVTDFLDSHTSEFVIMRVAYEALGWAPLEQDFDKSVSVGLFHDVEKKFSDRILPYRPDMKLGEARNHILLINDDEPSKKADRIGSYYHKDGHGDPNYNCYIDIVTDKDSTAYKFWVQDMYEMQLDDDNEINKKISLIKQVAEDAREYYKTSDQMVFNNQLNANTGNAVALKCVNFAQIFNERTFEIFLSNMLTGGKPYVGGIYSMDYAGTENYDRHVIPGKTTAVFGESAVWAIIENNFYAYGW